MRSSIKNNHMSSRIKLLFSFVTPRSPSGSKYTSHNHSGNDKNLPLSSSINSVLIKWHCCFWFLSGNLELEGNHKLICYMRYDNMINRNMRKVRTLIPFQFFFMLKHQSDRYKWINVIVFFVLQNGKSNPGVEMYPLVSYYVYWYCISYKLPLILLLLSNCCWQWLHVS